MWTKQTLDYKILSIVKREGSPLPRTKRKITDINRDLLGVTNKKITYLEVFMYITNSWQETLQEKLQVLFQYEQQSFSNLL
jgi:hypothetical protein